MSIIEVFNDTFSNYSNKENGVHLAPVNSCVYVGVEGNDVVLVLLAAEPTRNSIMQKTEKLVLQCTMSVDFICNDECRRETVHVLRCIDAHARERDIFLRLCEAIIGAEQNPVKEAYIIDVFSVLYSFFTVQKPLSDIQLQGLYTELYTIWIYKDKYPLHLYWQSKERMKFDFSFTERLKLEVKSTLSKERRHHFRHDQLTTEIHDIIVLSFLLQKDDAGESLYELILKCKELMKDSQDRVVFLEKVLYDTPHEQLDEMRFNQELMNHNMKFFCAKEIPRFKEETPDGVINVEYDCILNNIDCMDVDDVFNIFINTMKSEESMDA